MDPRGVSISIIECMVETVFKVFLMISQYSLSSLKANVLKLAQ